MALLTVTMLLNSGCASANTSNNTTIDTPVPTEVVEISTPQYETWYVNSGTGLNCRTAPTTEESEVIKVYNKGTALQIIGVDETGKWWETWDGETQGWCHSTYFSATKEEAEQKSNNTNSGTKGRYLGRFKITHYCTCATCNGGYGNSTAWAGRIIPGQTIAVDPSVIGKLQWVYIDGYGLRRAEDCGGAIKGNRIDMAVESHSLAYKLGVVYKDVYLAE